MVKYIYVFKTMCRDNEANIIKNESKYSFKYKLPFYFENSIDAYNISIVDTYNGSLKEPIEVFEKVNDRYDEILNSTKEFYNIILNTNYEYFEKEDFDINEYYKKINNCSFMTQKEVEEYVEYVKQNKVKIEGNGYVNIPMVHIIIT